MPKALCLVGLVLAILVCLIFLLDLILALAGSGYAPLQGASLLVDVLFVISTLGLAWVAWTTFREQK